MGKVNFKGSKTTEVTQLRKILLMTLCFFIKINLPALSSHLTEENLLSDILFPSLQIIEPDDKSQEEIIPKNSKDTLDFFANPTERATYLH